MDIVKKERKQVSEDEVVEVGFGFRMEILGAEPKCAHCVEDYCNLLIIIVDYSKLDLWMYLQCVFNDLSPKFYITYLSCLIWVFVGFNHLIAH